MANVILNTGDEITLGAGTHTIDGSGKVSFSSTNASAVFNSAGAVADTLSLAGASTDYNVSKDGTNLVLTHKTTGKAITIASGATGDTVTFSNGSLTLQYVAGTGVKLGTQTVGTTAATITDTPTGAGSGTTTGQSFSLTTGVDNIVGTSGNDTINGLVDDTPATNSTLTAADKVAGGAGTDTLNVTLVNTATAVTNAADISGVEIVNVRNVGTGTGAAALDASTITGLTEVNSDRSTGALTITNLATGAKAGVIGNGTVVNGVENVSYATGATAATLNLAGGTKAATLTTTNSSQVNLVAQTGLTSVTINSTGAANTVKGIYLNQKSDWTNAAGTAAVTSATINAATALDISGQGLTGFAGTAASITVAGAAANTAATATAAEKAAVALGTIEASTVKTLDASGLTAGGVSATLNTAITSFKGGAGNDIITAAATTATGASIDAGAGTGDTLVVTGTNDIATNGAAYKNFEVLKNTGTASLDASKVAGITSVETAGDAAGFTKLTAGQAANVKVSVTQTGDLTYALAADTGTADVLGLNVVGSTAASVVNAASLVVAGFETLNLTAGSGSKTLYDAAGTTQLTAGTGYDSFGFKAVANNDLKTVTLAGDYAAKVALTSNQAKVTTVDASNNKGGLDLVLGGQTGTVTVTGSDTRDVIALGAAGTGGLQIVNTGAGNDAISASQAVIAVATINGGDGTDTLTVTDTSTVTINDNNFAGVSAIEKLAFGATTGLTFSVGGYANALATANAGVLDVTAAALDTSANVAIDGTGLTAGNSLKLSLTNADAAGANAISVVLSQGADNITIKQTAGTASDTITINGGVAALASTAAKTIDLSGVTKAAATGNSVTTGAGADVIKAAVGVVATYTAGAGADTITLGAADGAAQTLKYDVANQSTTTAFDKVSNFQMVATNGDLLGFAGTTLLTSAQLGTGWTVSTGIATKTGATVADFIAAAAASTTAGVVAFSDGTDTYVAYSDGTAATTTSDQVVELVGLIGATSVSTTVGANVIGII